MKKETLSCDFCEEIFSNGGFRIVSKDRSNESLDICGDCLSEVVSDYAHVTGKTALEVKVSSADFQVLLGDDSTDGNADEVPSGSGFAAV
jgi:hypothetical protein